MSQEMWNLFDTVSVVGYPLVAWVCYRAGHDNGVEDAIEALHDQGVINLDE